MTLFSTSVHNVGLKCIVFLTFCRVAKLALDEIRFKKSLFNTFPIILPFSLYWPSIFKTLSLYWALYFSLRPLEALYHGRRCMLTMFLLICWSRVSNPREHRKHCRIYNQCRKNASLNTDGVRFLLHITIHRSSLQGTVLSGVLLRNWTK